MLSFMREQESRTASEPSSRRPGPPDSGSSNIPETQEYLTVAANSKSLRRSTILVAVLIGIGLLCLLLMIRKSQPQGAAAAGKNDQTKIEAAINRLTGVRSEMSGHMDEIVKKFYEFSDVVQVRVGELAKNPFEEESVAPDLRPVIATDGSSSREQQLEQQARRLKLLSIMRSEQGDCCMINDQILREGDMIGPFTIARVGSNFVELAWPASGASDVGTPNTGEMKTLLKLSE
jgi:hypothetical protein